MPAPYNRLARDEFVTGFLAASDCELIMSLACGDAANQDGGHIRDKLQDAFPKINIIKAFNDAAYRVQLARDFTAAHLFGGDRFLASDYLRLSGSYTFDVPQEEYVAESPRNLVTYCDMVQRLEMEVMRFQLGF